MAIIIVAGKIQMYEVGQIIESKKPHACGKNEWAIIRVGSDYKIKCNYCNRIVLEYRFYRERSTLWPSVPSVLPTMKPTGHCS